MPDWRVPGFPAAMFRQAADRTMPSTECRAALTNGECSGDCRCGGMRTRFRTKHADSMFCLPHMFLFVHFTDNRTVPKRSVVIIETAHQGGKIVKSRDSARRRRQCGPYCSQRGMQSAYEFRPVRDAIPVLPSQPDGTISNGRSAGPTEQKSSSSRRNTKPSTHSTCKGVPIPRGGYFAAY